MKSRPITILALSCALLCTPAANAGAKSLGTAGPFKYVSASKQLGSIHTGVDKIAKSVVAKCGRSRYPTGGGAQLPGPASSSDLVSSAWGDTHEWYVSGWHREADAKDLSAYAICAKSKGYRHFGAVNSIMGPNTGFANATCPSGSRLTGGGARPIGSIGDWVLSSSAPGQGSPVTWTTYAYVANSGPATLLTSIVCKKGPAPRTRTAKRKIDPNQAVTLRSSCDGQHVTGGGSAIDGDPAESNTLASRPYDGSDKDKVPDDGWQVRAHSYAGATLTVEAICSR